MVGTDKRPTTGLNFIDELGTAMTTDIVKSSNGFIVILHQYDWLATHLHGNHIANVFKLVRKGSKYPCLLKYTALFR